MDTSLAELERQRRNTGFLLMFVLLAIAAVALAFAMSWKPSWRASAPDIRAEAFAGSSTPARATFKLVSDRRVPFTAIETSAWMHVPVSGETPATLDIAFDPKGLAAGEYRSSVLFRADAFDRSIQVPVTFHVRRGRLVVSPQALSFGATVEMPGRAAGAATQKFTVTTDPPGLDIAWKIESFAPWLDIHPQSGRGPGEIRVRADAANLPKDHHAARIVIASPDAHAAEVRVAFAVQGAVVFGSPSRIEMTGMSAATGALTGGFDLRTDPADVPVRWSATSSVPWLSIAPTEGTGPAAIRVSADPSRLRIGTHAAVVTVVSPESAGHARVHVQVKLGGQPLLLSRSEISFEGRVGGTETYDAEFTIKAPDLEERQGWKIESAEPWLEFSPREGFGATTVKVTAKSADLGRGVHAASVLVVGETAALVADLKVRLDLKPVALQRVAPLAMRGVLGDAAPTSEFAIDTDPPGRNVKWKAAWTDRNHFRLDVEEGVTPARVRVTLQAGDLPAGNVTESILVTSDDADAPLAVEVKAVLEAPIPAVPPPPDPPPVVPPTPDPPPVNPPPQPTTTPEPPIAKPPPRVRKRAYVEEVNSALAAAKKADRLAMVSVLAEWCPWSRRLDGDTQADPRTVNQMADLFVHAYVNRDRLPDFVKRYDVTATPETLFIEPDGRVLTRIRGYRPPRVYQAMLESIASRYARLRELEAAIAKIQTETKAKVGLLAELLRLLADIEAWYRAKPVAELLAGRKDLPFKAVTDVGLVRGQSDLEAGNHEAARKQFQRALAADPENAAGRAETLYRGVVSAHFAEGNHAAALDWCADALDKFADSTERHWWWYARALAHRHLGQNEPAIQCADLALRGLPDAALKARIEQLREAARR